MLFCKGNLVDGIAEKDIAGDTKAGGSDLLDLDGYADGTDALGKLSHYRGMT
jgi:hypothetical protein